MAEQSLNIALVSMPWALFNRPSIQLGALKAYLENNSNILVQAYHPYLEIAKSMGVEKYNLLSRNGWAGDALYSALLYPENHLSAHKLFSQSCKNTRGFDLEFDTLCTILKHALQNWIARTDFTTCRLVGFSVCFNQLFSSLYAAQLIKHKFPHIQVVFGGSSCAGEMGVSLLNEFSQVDHIIAGEGENKLLELCENLFSGPSVLTDSMNYKPHYSPSICQPLQLDTLPTPDYQPYFSELQEHFPGLPFSPRVPLEFSRGCWWNKCTFCNLNLQWSGYRKKSAQKVVDEVRIIHKRYNNLDFTFCDNALPEKEADEFFSIMGKAEADYDFFAEIRPLNKPGKLKLYRKGGLTTVQVGIESLSDSLLKKMAKGTKVIENLAIMKYCVENSIILDGNIIVEFPGSTVEEVTETLANLDYALPYNPLVAATFFLGTGSPVDSTPAVYGIRAITQHRNAYKLFPKEILNNLKLVVKGYRGDRGRQQRQWQPVRQKIKLWQRFHSQRKNTSLPPLSYRDGGSFLIIRQERTDGPPLLHRLHGTSRKLYLFCSQIQSLEHILQEFQGLHKKTILNFFDDLGKKHLLFRDKNNFLALAVRVHH